MADESLELADRAIATVRKLVEREWFDEARRVLDQACPLHPNVLELTLLNAETYVRQGQMVEALQVLMDAHRRVPDHADLKLRLGQFLAIDGLHVAMDLFQRSEAQHEHPALVILERAMTLSDLGRFREALVEVERALKLEPDYWDAWMEMGRLNIELGDWAAAVRPLRRAMELEGLNAELAVDLAAAYLHQGFVDEAEKILDQGERLEPAHPGFAYYRAAVAAGRGQTAQALDYLRAALDSGHDGIRRLLQADRFFDALRERPELAELQGSPPQESNLRRFVPRNDRKGPIS